MPSKNKLLVIDACSLLTLALAGVALAGWSANARAAAALLPRAIPMAPNTALVLLLLAAAVWALARSFLGAAGKGSPVLGAAGEGSPALGHAAAAAGPPPAAGWRRPPGGLAA